jgi:hypothetical protein
LRRGSVLYHGDLDYLHELRIGHLSPNRKRRRIVGLHELRSGTVLQRWVKYLRQLCGG